MSNTKFFNSGKVTGKNSSLGAFSIGNLPKPKKKFPYKKLMLILGGIATVFAIVFLVAYLIFLRPALSLMSNVKTLKENGAQIQQAASERDLVEINSLLDKTEEDLKQLQKDRDAKIGWAKNLSFTKEYYYDSERFVQAGFHLIKAGKEFTRLVEPFADAGGFKIDTSSEEENVGPNAPGDTGLAEAVSTWVGIMPEIANDIDVVLEELSLAGEELEKIDASKYPEEFQGQPVRSTIETAQKSLVKINDAAPDIKRALTIIPPLLGVDTTEKRYMILMQNDKEIRATGGFWTYVATFKIKDAFPTSDFTSNGTYNVDFTLDDIDAYYTFPKVPAAYEKHLKVERMFARDANISPDLPTAADQFMTFWKLAMPLNKEFKPVDGVFTIDTVVLEEMLEITGPVTLNGVTYNPETVTIELEKIASLTLREQANRKKVLGDLMDAMLINVFNSDKNLWPKLINKGIELANRKHVQAYVFDPEGQALIEKYNYGGRIIDPVEGDYAFITSTNLGGGKTNSWFVNKEVTHKLEKEGTRFVRTVTAKFIYGDKPGDYQLFKTRYQDWVRLYVPEGSQIIEVKGSEDETGEGQERGKTYFHGYITLNPGETKEISFKYYLPDDLITTKDYSLYIQKQSGINTEVHYVEVNGKSEQLLLEKDIKYSTTL